MKYAHYILLASSAVLGVTYYMTSNYLCDSRTACFINFSFFVFSMFTTATAIIYSLLLPHDKKWFTGTLSLCVVTILLVISAPDVDPTGLGFLSYSKKIIAFNLGFLYALLSALYLLWHFFLRNFWSKIS